MGLARCSRQQARAVLSDPAPGGPLTQFASERFWAPAERLSVTIGGGAASPPPQSTCAPSQPPKQTQAAPIHQISKRTPAPASTACPPPPPWTPELAPVTVPVDAPWRLPARQRAWSGFVSLQSLPGFPEEQSPRASPTRGGGPKATSARRQAPGRARRGRAGGVWGFAQGAVPRSVLPGRRAAKVSGARGKGRGGARSRSGQGRAWAPGRCHYLASVVFPEPGRPRRR